MRKYQVFKTSKGVVSGLAPNAFRKVCITELICSCEVYARSCSEAELKAKPIFKKRGF